MKELSLILVIFYSSHVIGQNSISREVIGSAGKTVTTSSGIEYSFNIGEAVVAFSTSTNYILTQGFEQADYNIAPREVAFNPANAFSPDGDEVNDVWILPFDLINPSENKVTVFNRWGDIIVSLKNYNNLDVVWDGTRDGKEIPTGTYFYLVEIPEKNIHTTGWVQLVR